jgi:hypothetical protein
MITAKDTFFDPVFAQRQRGMKHTMSAAQLTNRRDFFADSFQVRTGSSLSLHDYRAEAGGLMISSFTGEMSERVSVFPPSVTTTFWKTHLIPSPSCNTGEFWT